VRKTNTLRDKHWISDCGRSLTLEAQTEQEKLAFTNAMQQFSASARHRKLSPEPNDPSRGQSTLVGRK
jgi:hypothetical protein